METYKDKQKKKKQLELANLFYEMGMSFDVIEKISGVESSQILNQRFSNIDKQKEKSYNDDDKK